MRTGLVAVGTAFAVVGAAVIVGVLYPGDDPSVARSSTAEIDGLMAGNWRPLVLPASPGEPTSLVLSWSASSQKVTDVASVNVSLYSAAPCPPQTEPCAFGNPLKSWSEKPQGTWTGAPGPGPLYMLYVEVPHSPTNATDNITATFWEVYRVGALPLPLLPLSLAIVGGGILTGLGAMAVYLGLFLPSGTFSASASEGTVDGDPELADGWNGGAPELAPDPPPPPAGR